MVSLAQLARQVQLETLVYQAYPEQMEQMEQPDCPERLGLQGHQECLELPDTRVLLETLECKGK